MFSLGNFRFSTTMFPDRIVVRHTSYVTSAQGGAAPTPPASGTTLVASVQLRYNGNDVVNASGATYSTERFYVMTPDDPKANQGDELDWTLADGSTAILIAEAPSVQDWPGGNLWRTLCTRSA